MAERHEFLALDIGAESGRGMLVTLQGGRARMEELHRFPNRPVRLAGTLTWDFPFLYAEVLEALRRCTQKGVRPEGISVSTWAVDFGLLGSDGKLLGNPVHYRDSRTENIHEYSDAIMPRPEIFAATGYEPWELASLFQLCAMRRDGSPLLDVADSFLNIPDLLNYFLTGRRANERSVLNTSNLMDTRGDWAEEIIERFGLPRRMFGEIIEPASVLGPLCEAVADDVGMPDVPVIVTCGHDTSAAVAAVPAEGEDWAAVSCGTWSILTCLIDEPITDPRCSELGFTNEYTIGGWYLGRNISGLWLVQELRRKWDTDEDPWDYARMTDAAAEVPAAADAGIVDAADDSLLAPSDMEDALLAVIEKHGQVKPDGRAELVRAALEGLALEYDYRLRAIGELKGKTPGALYIVGGGIANTLLCQLTANACGTPVYAGADQCTAMGNGLAQALALGVLKSREEIREVMRRSVEVKTYHPQDQELWEQKRKRYAEIQQSKS